MTSSTRKFKELSEEEIGKEIKKTKENYALVLKYIQKQAYSLNHCTVKYFNRSLKGQYGFSFHGYPLTVSTPKTLQVPRRCLPEKAYALWNSHRNIYYLGSTHWHAPFEVSEKLLKQATASTALSETSKQILHAMKGRTFPTAEHFVREFLIFKNPTQDLETIYAEAANEDLKGDLDIIYDLHSQMTEYPQIMVPYSSDIIFCQKDIAASYLLSSDRKTYPLIDSIAVMELFSLQKLFINSIEEQIGMGVSPNDEPKKTVNTYRILKRLTQFESRPNGYFSANCNTATATLLQEAEYISAEKAHRSPVTIEGASSTSIGSDHRMFFWGSRLNNLIVNAFINYEYKKDDPKIKDKVERLNKNPKELQELADNKEAILSLIETWPPSQYKKALEQIQDPSTPLGVVFLTRRTGYWRDPHPSRGKLKEAADKLLDLEKDPLKESKEPISLRSVP